MNQDRFQYCLDQLKRFDHDRYLSILLTPETNRAIFAAYFAFDAEMVRIPTTVSEPMLADIRFQWWRDTLESMTPSSAPGHEIAAALSITFFDRDLSPYELLPLIELRGRDLAEQPFETMEDLEQYHREIAQLQMSLFERVADTVQDSETQAQLETHLSAYGMVNQLRRLPRDVASSQLCLPLDMLSKHDVDPHDLFQGKLTAGFRLAIEEMLRHAQTMLQQAGPVDLRSSQGLIAPLLPTTLTGFYLAKLWQPDFDLFRHSSEIPAFRRQLRYLRVSWTKKI